MEYKGIFEQLQPTTNTHQDTLSTYYLTERNTHTIFSQPTYTNKLQYTNKHCILQIWSRSPANPQILLNKIKRNL